MVSISSGNAGRAEFIGCQQKFIQCTNTDNIVTQIGTTHSHFDRKKHVLSTNKIFTYIPMPVFQVFLNKEKTNILHRLNIFYNENKTQNVSKLISTFQHKKVG